MGAEIKVVDWILDVTNGKTIGYLWKFIPFILKVYMLHTLLYLQFKWFLCERVEL